MNYPPSENSWEPEESFPDKEALRLFEQSIEDDISEKGKEEKSEEKQTLNKLSLEKHKKIKKQNSKKTDLKQRKLTEFYRQKSS